MSIVRAAIYARSSLGIIGGQDPNLQVLELRRYSEARGMEITDVYIDVGSGSLTREKRPSLDRLLNDAKKCSFSVLLLSALDRAFRSTREMLMMVEELDHYGVRICSLREQLDFTSPIGKMALTVLAGVATLERDILRSRVKTGMAMRKLAAEKVGLPWRAGRPPITEAMIQKVLELKLEGHSAREIERRLDRQISRASVCRIINERLSQSLKKSGP